MRVRVSQTDTFLHNSSYYSNKNGFSKKVLRICLNQKELVIDFNVHQNHKINHNNIHYIKNTLLHSMQKIHLVWCVALIKEACYDNMMGIFCFTGVEMEVTTT